MLLGDYAHHSIVLKNLTGRLLIYRLISHSVEYSGVRLYWDTYYLDTRHLLVSHQVPFWEKLAVSRKLRSPV